MKISINENAAPDSRSYRVDFSMYEELAKEFQPCMDLHSAIAELRDGLIAMGFKDPAFRGSRYMRLEVLRQLSADGLLGADLEWVM